MALEREMVIDTVENLVTVLLERVNVTVVVGSLELPECVELDCVPELLRLGKILVDREVLEPLDATEVLLPQIDVEV